MPNDNQNEIFSEGEAEEIFDHLLQRFSQEIVQKQKIAELEEKIVNEKGGSYKPVVGWGLAGGTGGGGAGAAIGAGVGAAICSIF